MVGRHRQLVREALRSLQVDRLVLAIHDASFPSRAAQDVGRGSPYSAGAADLLTLAHELGFDGIQLGPQGQTTALNGSPYDATAFSRSTLSLALHQLVDDERWGWLLPREGLEQLVAKRPGAADRAQHAYLTGALAPLLAEGYRRFVRARAEGHAAALDLDHRLAQYRAKHAAWLEPDAIYPLLCDDQGHGDFRRWRDETAATLWWRTGDAAAAARAALRERHAAAFEQHALWQLALVDQHDGLRALARQLELDLYGDLQIGLSHADAWTLGPALLFDYLLGAPPSRTNPRGQPWGYPVLLPDALRPGGAAMQFFERRLAKIFDEFDALRIDHPHGLVCPWVYRADQADPEVAVQRGARLHSSPELEEHPALARYAIARADQIDGHAARHADDRVAALDDPQVERYATMIDAVVVKARAAGREAADVLCEVLSTQPYPLARVLARHGMGRFRVTQKADLLRADDVYRAENARPHDWIMVGTHDTPSLWQLLPQWQEQGALAAQAAYLAARLAPRPQTSATMAQAWRQQPLALAQAKFADLFASPARHVMVFFADLFGITERYNAPGTFGDHNWSLRLTPGFRARYRDLAQQGRALHLGRVLATALRAASPGAARARDRHQLADALEALPLP
jgi:4-alpha-glucanotransferase